VFKVDGSAGPGISGDQLEELRARLRVLTPKFALLLDVARRLPRAEGGQMTPGAA